MNGGASNGSRPGPTPAPGSTLARLWLVVLPKGIASVLQIGLNVALVFHFGPDSYGVIALCLTAIVVFDAIAGASLDVATVKLAPLSASRGNAAAALDIQRAAVLLKLGVWAIVVVASLAFSGEIGQAVLGGATDPVLIHASLLALLATLLFRTVQTFLQIEGRFRAYAAVELGLCVLRYGGIGVLLLASPSAVAVLAWFGIAPALVVTVTLLRYRALVPRRPLPVEALRALASTARVFVLAVGAGIVVTRMDVFLVASQSSVAQAGILSAAQIVAMVPQALGSYIAVVLGPRVMPLQEAGKLLADYRAWQQRLWTGAAALFVLGAPLLWLAGPHLMPSAFLEAVPTALALLPSGLAAFVLFPYTVAVLLYFKPYVPIVFDLIAAPLLLAIYLYVIPRHGVVGAACVTSAYALARSALWQQLAMRAIAGGAPKGAPFLSLPVARRDGASR